MGESQQKSPSARNCDEFIYDDIDNEIFATTQRPDENVSPPQPNNDLLEENKNLRESLLQLQEANALLETRISQLYLTAKIEIERKENQINEMKIERENMVFRRNNRYQHSGNAKFPINRFYKQNIEGSGVKSGQLHHNTTDNKYDKNSESKCNKESEKPISVNTKSECTNHHNKDSIPDSSKKYSNDVMPSLNQTYRIPKKIASDDNDINESAHIESKHHGNVYEIKGNKEDARDAGPSYTRNKDHPEIQKKFNQDRVRNGHDQLHPENKERYSESMKQERKYYFSSKDRDKDGYQHVKRSSSSKSRTPDRDRPNKFTVRDRDGKQQVRKHSRSRSRSPERDRPNRSSLRDRDGNGRDGYKHVRRNPRSRSKTTSRDRRRSSHHIPKSSNRRSRSLSRERLNTRIMMNVRPGERIQRRRESKECFRDKFLKRTHEISHVDGRSTAENIPQNKKSGFKDTESLYSEDEIKLFLSGESDFEGDTSINKHQLPDVSKMSMGKLERLHIELRQHIAKYKPGKFPSLQFSEDDLNVHHGFLEGDYDCNDVCERESDDDNKNEMDGRNKSHAQAEDNKLFYHRNVQNSERFSKKKLIEDRASLSENGAAANKNTDKAKKLKFKGDVEKTRGAADSTAVSASTSKNQVSYTKTNDDEYNPDKNNSDILGGTHEPKNSKTQNITLDQYKKRHAPTSGGTFKNKDPFKFSDTDNTDDSMASKKPDSDKMVVIQQPVVETENKIPSDIDSAVIDILESEPNNTKKIVEVGTVLPEDKNTNSHIEEKPKSKPEAHTNIKDHTSKAGHEKTVDCLNKYIENKHIDINVGIKTNFQNKAEEHHHNRQFANDQSFLKNSKNKITDEPAKDSVKKETLKRQSKTNDLATKEEKIDEGREQKHQGGHGESSQEISRTKPSADKEKKNTTHIKNSKTQKDGSVKSCTTSKQQQIKKGTDVKNTNASKTTNCKNQANRVTDKVEHRDIGLFEEFDVLKQQIKTNDNHVPKMRKENDSDKVVVTKRDAINKEKTSKITDNSSKNTTNSENKQLECLNKSDEQMSSDRTLKRITTKRTIKTNKRIIIVKEDKAEDKNTVANDTKSCSNVKEPIKESKNVSSSKDEISDTESEIKLKLTSQLNRKQKYDDDNLKIEAAETLCSLASNQICEQKLENQKDRSEPKSVIEEKQTVSDLNEHHSESSEENTSYSKLAQELYLTDSDEDENICESIRTDTDNNQTEQTPKCIIISDISVILSQEDLEHLALKNQTNRSKLPEHSSESIGDIKKAINIEYTKTTPQQNARSKSRENSLNSSTTDIQKCLEEDTAVKYTDISQSIVERRSSNRLTSVSKVMVADDKKINVKITESAKQVKDLFSSTTNRIMHREEGFTKNTSGTPTAKTKTYKSDILEELKRKPFQSNDFRRNIPTFCNSLTYIPIKNPELPFDSPNSFITKTAARLSSEKDNKHVHFYKDKVIEESEAESDIQDQTPKKRGKKCTSKKVVQKPSPEKGTSARPIRKTPKKMKYVEEEATQCKSSWKIRLADNSKKRKTQDTSSDDSKRKKRKADKESDGKSLSQCSKEKSTDSNNERCTRSDVDSKMEGNNLGVKRAEEIATTQEKTPETHSDSSSMVNSGKTLKRITPKRIGECTKSKKGSNVKVITFAESSKTAIGPDSTNISQRVQFCVSSVVQEVQVEEKSEQKKQNPNSSPLASFENLYLQANLKRLEKQKSSKAESNKPSTHLRASEEAEFTDIHIDPITLLENKEIDNIISDLNISDKHIALSSNSDKSKSNKTNQNENLNLDEKKAKSKENLDFLNILSKNTSTPIKNRDTPSSKDSTVAEQDNTDNKLRPEQVNTNTSGKSCSLQVSSNFSIPSNTSSETGTFTRSSITIGVPLKRDRRRKSVVTIMD
ncbi:uncharacterized protein LOC143202964 isoform X3 [Rhynchophorus ferrugineus]|uniref:uncharacterized protein LOC143202964 isoform X3 n=1 Tax=Rhynchophorus ferrugineus TaxID=354439 RepID=UPI003FCDDFFB